MTKKRIGILVVLGIIILSLVILNLLPSKQVEKEELTLERFYNRYQKEMKQVDKTMLLDTKYQTKKEDKKLVYHFENDCYLVISYNQEKHVEKVYFHVLKENYKKSDFQKRLSVLVKSMNPNLSEDGIQEIVSSLQEIEGKKADEVGLLVQFEQEQREYITMEKENGKALEFFVYLEKED